MGERVEGTDDGRESGELTSAPSLLGRQATRAGTRPFLRVTRLTTWSWKQGTSWSGASFRLRAACSIPAWRAPVGPPMRRDTGSAPAAISRRDRARRDSTEREAYLTAPVGATTRQPGSREWMSGRPRRRRMRCSGVPDMATFQRTGMGPGIHLCRTGASKRCS